MNSSLVTTGPEIFTAGSTMLMQLNPRKDYLFWPLTGGNAWLLLTDPNGTSYVLAGTVQTGGGAVVPWTVPAIEGTWVRAWRASEGGITLITVPLVFRVVVSPGFPF